MRIQQVNIFKCIGLCPACSKMLYKGFLNKCDKYLSIKDKVPTLMKLMV